MEFKLRIKETKLGAVHGDDFMVIVEAADATNKLTFSVNNAHERDFHVGEELTVIVHRQGHTSE